MQRTIALLALCAIPFVGCSSDSSASTTTAAVADTGGATDTGGTTADTTAGTTADTTSPTPAPTTPAPTTTTPAPTTPTTAAFVCLRTPATWDDNVRFGDCGDIVQFIQERLTVLGFPTTADGRFGRGTDSAVRAFQRAKSLTADGQVGPNTWAKLVEGGIGD